MDMKAVDLQMALPRLQDASVLQQQQTAKPMLYQQILGQESLKKTEQDRQKTLKTESPAETRIADEGEQEARRNADGGAGKRKRKEEREARDIPAAHPFKGKYIDLRG
jgi:hypothetical protein